MISCEDVLGKGSFDIYPEFYFALCLGEECNRRGMVLDMSSMVVEPDSLPNSLKSYFKYLLGVGALHLEGVSYKPDINAKPDYDVDFTGFEDKLLENRGTYYSWSSDYLVSAFKDNIEITKPSLRGKLLIRIVAFYVLSRYLGELEDKPFIITLTGNEVTSTYLYLDIMMCKKFLSVLDNVVFDAEFPKNFDIDYIIFFNTGVCSGRYNLWSVTEKRNIFSQLGYKEGMIGLLWERRGMCSSNPAGSIVDVRLVKVNKVGKTYIDFTSIPLFKTREEVYDDYLSIDEDIRDLYTDMLTRKPVCTKETIEFYELGISNYLENEYLFFTELQSNKSVIKKITVDGKTSEVEMSEVDAIYWLLCQYGVEFDKDLFRSMYNGGKPLLADLYL